MSTTEKLAHIIEKRLEKLKISRTKFAALMGVPPSSITKWLKGEHNFTIDTLFRIERVLHMQIFVFSDPQQQAVCFPCEFKALTKPVTDKTDNK